MVRFRTKEEVGKSLNRSPRAAISVDTVIVATSIERERERERESALYSGSKQKKAVLVTFVEGNE